MGRHKARWRGDLSDRADAPETRALPGGMCRAKPVDTDKDSAALHLASRVRHIDSDRVPRMVVLDARYTAGKPSAASCFWRVPAQQVARPELGDFAKAES